jgi:hypothetical protein
LFCFKILLVAPGFHFFAWLPMILLLRHSSHGLKFNKTSSSTVSRSIFILSFHSSVCFRTNLLRQCFYRSSRRTQKILIPPHTQKEASTQWIRSASCRRQNFPSHSCQCNDSLLMPGQKS